MSTYLASTVLMIRPLHFGFNPETAATNSFQQQITDINQEILFQMLLEEFDNMVSLLRASDIEVLLFDDLPQPECPDAVFPNNWFSTHSQGLLITYPMYSPNRRWERRNDILKSLCLRYNYRLEQGLQKLENQNLFLEGTGSLVLDRSQGLAYAALSPRTHLEAIVAWEQLTGYKTLTFRAFGPQREAIYHTNVMLSIGDNFALIGAESIAAEDKTIVLQSLKQSGKEIIELTNEQIYENFAGNLLALQNTKGERFLVMSTTAKRSLTAQQRYTLEQKSGLQLLAAPLSLIETMGGGSARCMMAEVFAPL